MSPVLVDLIGAVLAALFILDYEVGALDLARRFWPRPSPRWARLLTSLLCFAPIACWLLYGYAQGLTYAAWFFIFILAPAEFLYLIGRRWYVKRQLRRRQLAAAPTMPTTPSTPTA